MVSASDQFFGELLQLGLDVEQSIQTLYDQYESGKRNDDLFISQCNTRINELDAQLGRMKKCLFSQKSTDKKTNLSLQYILSICQIILDENEILLDDIEEQTALKVKLSRETLYDNALQIFRDNQEQSFLPTVNEPDIRSSISRLSATSNSIPISRLSVNELDVRSSISRLSATSLRLLTPLKQHLPPPSSHSTPSLNDLGLSTSSLQALKATSTPLHFESIKRQPLGHTPVPSAQPVSRLSNSSFRSSLQHSDVNINQALNGMAFVEKQELASLPNYLTNQLPSLDALNECISVIRSIGTDITQSELKKHIMSYSEEKHLRVFLLILLKLKRFSRTSRDSTTNELTYHQ